MPLVAVSTTPTSILAPGESLKRRSYSVQNVSDADVFLGKDSKVLTTSAYDLKLEVGSILTLDMDRLEVLYGVVASGSKNVATMAVGSE